MKDILEVMAYDSDSSSTSSSCSSGEDLDALFLDTLFCPQQEFRHKIDFEALSDRHCVEMFRWIDNTWKCKILSSISRVPF